MLHDRLKNIEQQNRSVIWTFVTFCVLVVSFPALYVFLCRLICPSNQSRYSVVWWRNIFRRNNLIILPYTKKWFRNLWPPRPAVSQRLNWKCQLFFFTQSTKNRAKIYAHVDLPWRTFDPIQRLRKMSFLVFYSENLFSGLSTKNSTSGKILTLDQRSLAKHFLSALTSHNHDMQLNRWNLSVIGLEYREMFQADCPLEQNSSGCALIWRILWPNSLFQFIPLPLLWNNIKVKLLQILFANVGKQTQPKHKFKHSK